MATASSYLNAPAPRLQDRRRRWTREVWYAAYRQSRAQIRDGGRHRLGARYV